MATRNQKEAAQQNIQKAQEKWENMSKRQRSHAQPEGRARAKPGTKGEGKYYRVVVRPKNQFTTFRTHDIGRPGHTQRLVGRRSSGSWSTQAWLIHKGDAHVSNQNGQLILSDDVAEDLSGAFRGPIYHEKGDVFRAKPRKNVPEKDKPTQEQKRARQQNIHKAQQARHSSR